MKNYVNFETASRLKAAGFPQPEPEFGQVWYAPGGTVIIIVRTSSRKVDYVIDQFSLIYRDYKDDFFQNAIVFAPTAADIFLSIGSRPFLHSENGDEMMFLMLTNPERAASFWIGFNEKKQEQ